MFLHIDGDAFFASCEIALDPKLKGKPVVTGLEKGIASSMNYQAKHLGVTRAMPVFQIRKLFPQVIIVDSDFDIYCTFSRRMFTIVRRYTGTVEEYSIDECFADLSGYAADERALLDLGKKIKKEIWEKLAITVSLGIAPTKVLAKAASKWQKPDGLTCIAAEKIPDFLQQIPIGKIWGIGASTSVTLNKLKIFTAGEFILKPESWVREHLAKPYVEIWYELRGIPVHAAADGTREKHKSIMKTRMFKPPSKDPAYIFSELSKNIENACIKARHYGLAPSSMSFYLKTQAFSYHTTEVRFGKSIVAAHELVHAARVAFARVYRANTLYRATGVTLHAFTSADITQVDLFGNHLKDTAQKDLYKEIDALDKRFGKHTLFLASSLKALTAGREKVGKRALPLPFMGEVR